MIRGVNRLTRMIRGVSRLTMTPRARIIVKDRARVTATNYEAWAYTPIGFAIILAILLGFISIIINDLRSLFLLYFSSSWISHRWLPLFSHSCHCFFFFAKYSDPQFKQSSVQYIMKNVQEIL
jgi:hypothetical protein